MRKYLYILVVSTGVFLLPAHAQMRATVVAVRARGASPTGGFTSTSAVHGQLPGRSGLRRFYPPFLLGDAYYYSDYRSDDTSQPAGVDAPPQIMVIEMPSSAAPQVTKETAEPLLIEWQDGRYVRIGGTQAEGDQALPSSAKTVAASAPVSKPAEIARRADYSQPPAAPELQPVELVYRDGHHEQIREYTIANGVLYATGDYWTDGYWTKKIQLAALNLPARSVA